MSAGIKMVDGIIATIGVEIQSVMAFRVKVVKGVGRNPSAPSGVVIPRLHPVKSCFGVKVVSTVSYLAILCKAGITTHSAVAVGIILEGHQLCATAVVHTNHVALDILYYITSCFARNKKGTRLSAFCFALGLIILGLLRLRQGQVHLLRFLLLHQLQEFHLREFLPWGSCPF